MQALRRFISNRGCPKMIFTDNGTNFTGAERELRQSVSTWKQETIQSEMRSKEIEWEICPIPKWRFQPSAASHMSGVWERLIRSVRKSMTAVIGQPHAYLSKETLRTLFAEVVTILNSRPLCPSSEDPNDLEPVHQTTYCFNAEVLLSLLVCFLKIYTPANNGDEPNS